jgi:hypothetical protein
MVGCSDAGRFPGIKLLEIAESFTPFSPSQVIGMLQSILFGERKKERGRGLAVVYINIYMHTHILLGFPPSLASVLLGVTRSHFASF